MTNATVTRKPVTGEADITLELPKEVLMAIRIAGVYDEITIDPESGQVLTHIHVTGRYDSYSDNYELNGKRWKVQGHVSWPDGEEIYALKLEKPHARSRK